jgi:hypothetical protein
MSDGNAKNIENLILESFIKYFKKNNQKIKKSRIYNGV